jgi:hypothetical protein
MYWCQRSRITAQQAPSVAPPAATISRHSDRLPAVQTPFHHQGKAVQTSQATKPTDRTVSRLFSQPENRFSCIHFTAPRSDTGGVWAGSIWVRTKLWLISALLQLDGRCCRCSSASRSAG